MIAFFGPSQAIALSVHLTDTDVLAMSSTHRAVATTLNMDHVWRQMLAAHFEQAFACLTSLQAGTSEDAWTFVSRLPKDAARKMYPVMRGTSAGPFILEPRARLKLEINEVREWDKHQRSLIVFRQAKLLADALALGDLAQKLPGKMGPDVLELVSLHTMVRGANHTPRLVDLSEVAWGPTADTDLSRAIDRRLQQRRQWRQRQRDFLLQDLEWK